MPPKAVTPGAAEANLDVLVLINLIRTATEFKADMNEMARIYKIAQAKNVPRKINAVIAPHGFKWERGKIEQDGVARDKDQGGDGEKTPKTPTKSTRKAPKTPKSKEPKTQKSNKKRKIDEEEEEAESDDADLIQGEEDIVTEPFEDEDAAKEEEGVAEDASDEDGE